MSDKVFIPVPGLEDAIDHSERGESVRSAIFAALLGAVQNHTGSLLMELYFPQELPPEGKTKRCMRFDVLDPKDRNICYVTAYVTQEAVVRAATKLNRPIRVAPKRVNRLIEEASEWELSVKFVTTRRSVLIPWEEFAALSCNPHYNSFCWEDFRI